MSSGNPTSCMIPGHSLRALATGTLTTLSTNFGGAFMRQASRSKCNSLMALKWLPAPKSSVRLTMYSRTTLSGRRLLKNRSSFIRLRRGQVGPMQLLGVVESALQNGDALTFDAVDQPMLVVDAA